MAKKINPMLAVVGGLLAVLLLFSIISIVFYPGAPIELEGGHGADGHGSDAVDDTVDHGNESSEEGDAGAEDENLTNEGDSADTDNSTVDGADNGTENNTSENGTAATEVTASAGDTVFVHYVGKFENGTVFTSTGRENGSQPVSIVLGQNPIVKGFDSAVVGMKINETKTAVVSPEDGYPSNSALIITFDRTQIVSVFGSVPNVGDKIIFSNGGQTPNGAVLEVTANSVLIDFNDETVGKVLTYEITVTEIQKN